MAVISETSYPESAPAAHRKGLGPGWARLWLGFALASSGDGLAYGAVPLLALVVDPRPLAVSAVVAADGLPWLLVAIPAGAFADRYERRTVMAAASAVRALLLAGVAALVVFHRVDLALLILAVLANAAGRAVYYSAAQASVPDLVKDSMLDRANGQLSATEAASEHLGGPIAGTLLFSLARVLPFAGEALLFGLSSWPFRRLPRSQTEVVEPSVPRTSVWDGTRRLWRDRRLRLLLTLVATLAGLQGLVSGVLVLVATRDWGVHTAAYGVFVASGAAGNLPGALLADRVSARLGSIPALVMAAVISGAAYLVMAMAHLWIVAGAAFFVAGFAIGVGIVVSNTLRQRLAPPELMGRIGAAWRGIAWGAAPVGALAAGTVALFGGLRLPLVLAGALQCAVAVVLFFPLLRATGSGAGKGLHAVRGRH